MSVTLAMIVISVAIYVIINFIDHSDEKSALAIKYGAFYPPKIEYKQEYWRFLTANFVHVDLVHIFMNCYALYYLGGTFFEPFLGSLEYLYLVLISGIFSYLITYMASKKEGRYQNTITLGASGIFYGFLGAIVTLGVVFQGPFLMVLKQFIPVIAINVVFTLASAYWKWLMRLLIDGDACPDRQKVIELALHYGVEVLLFIDFAHVIEDERIQIIMCEVGKDSVDQMILSYLQEGDLLISQDYGLASLALLKNVTILHVSGKRITEDNINNLLTSRYLGHLSRKQHKHVKGPKKRNYKASQFFLRELEKIFIENKINEEKAILE